ncbi:MAG: hypothetical protein JST85_30550 [Acidobacteria bacterium]|nr:hypothetical protein [Acidobacteriota bacterium]
MKDSRLKASKRLLDRIFDCHTGVGLLVYKSGTETVTQVEVFVDKDGQLKRIHDGKPVLPIHIEGKEEHE